jgi:hypothetical protein
MHRSYNRAIGVGAGVSGVSWTRCSSRRPFESWAELDASTQSAFSTS